MVLFKEKLNNFYCVNMSKFILGFALGVISLFALNTLKQLTKPKIYVTIKAHNKHYIIESTWCGYYTLELNGTYNRYCLIPTLYPTSHSI